MERHTQFEFDDLDDFDFDDTEQGDIRRWLDVVSNQLAMLGRRLLSVENPRELTTEGVRVGGALLDAYHSLQRGEMIDGDHVRQLLDVVMSSSGGVLRPRTTSIQPARAQERADNLTSVSEIVRHTSPAGPTTLIQRQLIGAGATATIVSGVPTDPQTIHQSVRAYLAVPLEVYVRAMGYHIWNGVAVDTNGVPVPLHWYYNDHGIVRGMFVPAGWQLF